MQTETRSIHRQPKLDNPPKAILIHSRKATLCLSRTKLGLSSSRSSLRSAHHPRSVTPRRTATCSSKLTTAHAPCSCPLAHPLPLASTSHPTPTPLTMSIRTPTFVDIVDTCSGRWRRRTTSKFCRCGACRSSTSQGGEFEQEGEYRRRGNLLVDYHVSACSPHIGRMRQLADALHGKGHGVSRLTHK